MSHQPAEAPRPSGAGFCGECGATLAPGVQFCGECGSATGAPASPLTQRLCPACGATTKPGQGFCRICGIGLQGAQAKKPATAGPARPAAPAEPLLAPEPMSPAAPRQAGARMVHRVLGVVVPIASLVLTYYLTNRALGTMLAQQFGDLGRQLVPLVVSMAVGGIARQLMSGKS